MNELVLTSRALAEPWRLLTCHLVHWTWPHAAWNLLAAFIPFAMLSERERRTLAVVLALSAPALSLALLHRLGGGSYAGLSGLASAGWAFAGLRRWPQPWGWALLALLGMKLAVEHALGGPLLASAEGWQNLPEAHLYGALLGGSAACAVGRRASSS